MISLQKGADSLSAMKKGFPHCDTPESLELVQAQFPTLFLEGLGNHQILL